jgi:prevent-host-death family protein
MKGRSVPIGQARPRLTEILEIAQREPVTITKDGVPAAVVVSPEDYESLVATIELLRNPEARERLREFEERTKQGLLEFVSGEEAERQLLA